MPPEKDHPAGIDRLFTLVTDDLHKHLEPGDTAALTAWGAVFNAIHLTRGIKTLHQAGCCASVPPLLRSLLEYTMGTLWLADAREDAVQVLARGMLRNHTTLNRSIRRPEVEPFLDQIPRGAVEHFEAQLAEDIDKHADERLLGFTHLLEEYGFPVWVPAYNTLSNIAHFTSIGAQRYFRQSPTGWDLSQMPLAPEVAPCVETAFPLLLDAMAAFDRLTTDHPWNEALEQLAAEYECTITVATRRSRQA